MLRIDLSGAKDSSNTIFTLAQAPVTGGELFIVQVGKVLKRVLSTPGPFEYTLSGLTITVGTPPAPGDGLFGFVQIDLTQSLTQTTFTGLSVVSNLNFTLGSAPPVGTNLVLFKNGLVLEEVPSAASPTQFVITGTTVTLGTALAVTDWVLALISAPATATLSAQVLTGNQDGLNTRFVTANYAPPLNYEPDLLVLIDGVLSKRVINNPLAGQYALVDPRTIRLGSAPNASVSFQVYLIGTIPLTVNPYTFTCERLSQRLGIWTQRRVDEAELQEVVSQSYQEFVDMYQWTFLNIDGTFATEPTKLGGTVAVSQYSRIVAGTGTVFTASDIGKRFRLSSFQNSYEIISVNVPNQTLEINPPYIDVAATGQNYEVFKSIYPLGPEVEYVFSMGSRWPMRELSLSVLDRIDPTRASRAEVPTRYVYRGKDANGVTQIELYPVPSQTCIVRYSGIRKDACTDASHVLRGLDALIINSAAAAAFRIIEAKTGAADPWERLSMQYEAKAAQVLQRLLDLDFTRSDIQHIQGMRDDAAWVADGAYMAEHDAWLIPGTEG